MLALDPLDITYGANTLPLVLSAVTVVPFPSPSAANGTSSLELMQHFQKHWVEIFDMPRSCEIIPLSQSYSHVRNTILTISACHLRHLAPDIPQHRVAEHFQQSLALQEYQKALDTPLEALGQPGVDALLVSAILLNILAFALPSYEDVSHKDPDPTTSWVFSPRKDRVGWLAMQAGLKPLLQATTKYLDKTLSFLATICFGLGHDKWEFVGVGEGLEQVPDTWIEVFELTSGECGCERGILHHGAEGTESGKANDQARDRVGDVFRQPAKMLAELRTTMPTKASVFKYLQFVAKLEPHFRALLRDRDERALWLFGYWLGLMCRYNGLWWCDKRVRRDYKAIHMLLDQLHLTDRRAKEGAMWKEMMVDLDSACSFS
jgi:hypothetical protein